MLMPTFILIMFENSYEILNVFIKLLMNNQSFEKSLNNFVRFCLHQFM